MSKVYVIMNQQRWDKDKKVLVPVFDFTQAEGFGQVEYLLSPTARPLGNTQSLSDELHRKLASYRSEDYLLLVGSPILIGMAVAIAANYSDGVVSMLQWHGRDGTYTPVTIDLKRS